MNLLKTSETMPPWQSIASKSLSNRSVLSKCAALWRSPCQRKAPQKLQLLSRIDWRTLSTASVMKNSLLPSYMNGAPETDSTRDFIVRKRKLIKLEAFFIILPSSRLIFFYIFIASLFSSSEDSPVYLKWCYNHQSLRLLFLRLPLNSN